MGRGEKSGEVASNIKKSVLEGFQTSKLTREWGNSPVLSQELDSMISRNFLQPMFHDYMVCMLVKFDSSSFLHKLRIYRKAQKITGIHP